MPLQKATSRTYSLSVSTPAGAAYEITYKAPDTPTAVAGVKSATASFTSPVRSALYHAVRAAAGAIPATNLLAYTQAIDNAVWAPTAASVSPDTRVAPDGTTTMDKVVETTQNAGHYVQALVSTANGASMVGSVFIAPGERSRCDVLVYRGSTFAGAHINLLTGALSAPQTGGVSSIAGSASAVLVGNGVYRVMLPYVSDGTQGGIRPMLSNGTATTYAGDGVSGLYVWGAQLEAGTVATSYQRQDASGTRYHPVEFGASPVTVTGLQTGSGYTLSAQAVNAYGASLSSAASNSVVPT